MSRPDRGRRTPAGRPRPASARAVALETLRAVEEREAFLQPALEGAARRAGLSRRDRALALELVMGVERWRRRLDAALAPHLRRGFDRTPPDLVRLLRLGAYQLLHLDRIPARAAVHETVEAARAAAGEGAARFVNGVLRSVQRAGPPAASDIDDLGVRYSHPDWLVDAWTAAYGPEFTRALCAADNEPAPLTGRVDGPELDRAGLLAALEAEGARAEPARHAPDAVHIHAHPAPFDGRAFREGLWVAQDEAAQLVVLLLDPRPGNRVWDVCAAPGGKSRYIARRLAGEGSVLATDVHPAKVDRLARDLADRPVVRVARHDATEPPPEGDFDRVLVDAPCSGLGVLRRHPEIRWRRTPDDVRRLAEQQRRILRAAAAAVRPGGVIVYAVCTVTPEEGPDVVASFLSESPGFTLEPPPSDVGVDWTDLVDGDYLRTWPHRHGTDGFFAARLRRAGAPES